MTRKWTAASAAICTMWIAVLFIAIFAPELHATSAGGDSTTLPLAGIVTAAVAFIATIVVASVGFGGRGRDSDVEVERLERERLEQRIRELEAQLTPQNDTPQPPVKARALFSR
jgi:uncharacterized membrane protein (DUF485 family)